MSPVGTPRIRDSAQTGAERARSAVARNYAATLYELARREDEVEGFGELIDEVGGLYRAEPEFRRFLQTPRISVADKQEALRNAFGHRAPEMFVRFLLVMLDKGRQRHLPEVASAYKQLVEEAAGRVHASVTLAPSADESLRSEFTEALQGILGREVVPHFREDPEILGGVVVRIDDRLMDGSLRRRLEDMRAELLGRAGERLAGAREGDAAGPAPA